MKKIKYLLLKTHKQKSKLSPNDQIQSQYINTIKHQAIKSIQHFQQNCLNQTHLNITLTSDRPSSQYRSRSDQRENMCKTFQSKHSNIKPNPFNQKSLYDTTSLNIRKLMRYFFLQNRIKTEVQEKQADKLKDPFYKIQKVREIPKKMSLVQRKQQIMIKQNASLCLKNQKQLQVIGQKESENVFISRQKKQWYFASKKFRSRTIQQEQSTIVSKKSKESEKKMPQSLILSKSMQEKQDGLGMKTQHQRVLSSFAEFESIEELNWREGPKARYTQENEEKEHNGEEKKGESEIEMSSSLLRERSLTVKYNEIKDYFEKKYNKQNLNDYEKDQREGYSEEKVAIYE